MLSHSQAFSLPPTQASIPLPPWPQQHPEGTSCWGNTSPGESDEDLEPRGWLAVETSSCVSLLSLCDHHVKRYFLFQKKGTKPPSLAHSQVLAKLSVIHLASKSWREVGLRTQYQQKEAAFLSSVWVSSKI